MDYAPASCHSPTLTFALVWKQIWHLERLQKCILGPLCFAHEVSLGWQSSGCNDYRVLLAWSKTNFSDCWHNIEVVILSVQKVWCPSLWWERNDFLTHVFLGLHISSENIITVLVLISILSRFFLIMSIQPSDRIIFCNKYCVYAFFWIINGIVS